MTTIFRHAVILAAMTTTSAMAQPFQDHAAIDTQVAARLVGTGYLALPVDRRIKLAACPAKLEIAEPALSGVAVRCPPLGWRLRVLMEGPPATVTYTPAAIKRGDPVTVSFVAPGFSVTSSGIADGDARIGERVRVRVAQQASPVVGDVVDAGSVRVTGLNQFGGSPL